MSQRVQINGVVGSEAGMIALGRALAAALLPRDIVALHGELGTGKTRLVRGVAEGLGIDPRAISSPTYVIAQEYEVPWASVQARITRLVHMDAYRLQSAGELDSIGWDVVRGEGEIASTQAEDARAAEGARRAGPVLMIEWAERLGTRLPAGRGRLDITLAHAPLPTTTTLAADGPREIVLLADPSWLVRPGWAGMIEQIVPTLGDSAPTDTRPQASAGSARASALPSGWARCPVTGQPVPPDSPTFPFANERARLSDLGRWFSGSYRMSRDLTPDDADSLDA